MTPSTALKERISAELSRHPSRTRAAGRRRAFALYACAAVAGLIVFQRMGGLEHSASRPLRYTLLIALGTGVVAFVVSRFTLFRSLAITARPTSVSWLIAAAVPVVTLLWLEGWHGHYVEPPQRLGLRCLVLALSTGGLLLIVTLFIQKHTLPRATAATGAALGAACAAWAAIFVVLWCPLTNARHACVGHVLPTLLLTALGALLGSRILAIRPR